LDGPDREVTLIEAEAFDGLAREYEVTLDPVQTRRNLLTRGVPLNHLVCRSFKVGAVILQGVRLCEPCAYLEKLTCKGVKTGLAHCGGLRAQIIQGGTLEVGFTLLGDNSHEQPTNDGHRDRSFAGHRRGHR
jgi:MOSC domain-containing protein YiiM